MSSIIILLLPIVIGLIITLVNSPAINSLFERSESWLKEKQQERLGSTSTINRFLFNPILKLFVLLSDWTDNIASQGLKSGAKAAIILYIAAFSVYFSVFFVMIIVTWYMGIIAYNLFRATNKDFREDTDKIRDAIKEGKDYGNRSKITKD